MATPQKNLKKLIPQLKTELAYSKVEHLLSIHYEEQLEKEVSKIFSEMEYQVIQNLAEYYNPNVMFKAQMDLILSPIHELHKKYYEVLIKYKIREFDKARASGKRIVERTINFKRKGNVINRQYTILKEDISLSDMVSSTISKDKLFGTNPLSHENLCKRTYNLSEKTLARVDENINSIITTGYDNGMGINSVSKDIRRRFGQLKSWESKRIARTEIHNSHSLGLIQGYDDMGVQYIEWSSANDERVRDSHIHLDGEIIPLGGVFSNGLRYPGDMDGPASEVINCRCQALPFIMPYGYEAPSGATQFRESDLVRIDVPDLNALIGDTPEKVSVEEQLSPYLEKFLTDKKEIDIIKKEISSFVKDSEGLDHEILTAIDTKHNVSKLIGDETSVSISDDVLMEGHKHGLLFSIHNHPGEAVQPSVADINVVTRLREQLSAVYSSESKELLLMNNKYALFYKDGTKIAGGYYKAVFGDDILSKYTEYRKTQIVGKYIKTKNYKNMLKKYKQGKLSKEEFDIEHQKDYEKFIMDNLDKNIKEWNKLLKEEGVEFVRIKLEV